MKSSDGALGLCENALVIFVRLLWKCVLENLHLRGRMDAFQLGAALR